MRIEFENNCWVETVTPDFNLSAENRINVAHLANITRGGFESKNPKLRFNQFLSEAGGMASVPLEFIPVSISKNNLIDFIHNKIDIADYLNNIVRYSFIVGNYNGTVLTNLRTILKASIPLNEIPFNTEAETKDFIIIRGRVPAKTISHLRTHRGFSWLVESSRNGGYKPEFWLPESKFEKIDENRVGLVGNMINEFKVKPEIANMEYSDRRLVHFAMCAWKQDPSSYENLIKVRGAKTGTMSITGITVDTIKKLVNG